MSILYPQAATQVSPVHIFSDIASQVLFNSSKTSAINKAVFKYLHIANQLSPTFVANNRAELDGLLASYV